MENKAVVLLSGGMDSAVALAVAMKECDGWVTALSFSYGQRHVKELLAASELAQHYDIPHFIYTVEIPKAGSVLMGEGAMPQMTYEELQKEEGPSPTYVPFRNGTFLSLATAYALDLDAQLIYAAMHADDGHNWAYPDCTPEFVGAMQNAIYVGTYHKVRLRAPFVYSTKAQIAMTGNLLKTPFHLTWSCYEGRTLHCGTCPTCVSRIEAFKIAGVNDPTNYETMEAA